MSLFLLSKNKNSSNSVFSLKLPPETHFSSKALNNLQRSFLTISPSKEELYVVGVCITVGIELVTC